MSYKKIDLLKYSHDRSVPFKKSADELFNLINSYSDQKDMLPLYKYFENAYGLPKAVVQQKIKQTIARSYLANNGKFRSRLYIKNIPKFLLQYGILIYALFFTKKKSKVKIFKLLIDDVLQPLEFRRFSKLIDLVGKDNVICRTDGVAIDNNFSQCYIYNGKRFRDLNLVDLLKSIVNELFIGIWVVLKVSIKTKVNLFPISLRIIYSYLTFKSLFESNAVQYMIQERHYNTNPIKNYIFKKNGGVRAATIQKGVFQRDPMFFYMDIDVFYSLGESGVDEFLEYGGRVGSVVPVGSMFMEYYWFSNIPSNLKQEYDVVYLGFNLSDKMNSYDGFLDDYYSSFKWLVQLKKENPDYRIGIAHHSRAKIPDTTEAAILLDSGVETIGKLTGSYALAFSSRYTATYGSTIAYELSAHNAPTFFLDPGRRCTFLPVENIDYLDQFRLVSYDDFSNSVKDAISGKKRELLTEEQKANLCLNSSTVSDRIYKSLGSNV